MLLLPNAYHNEFSNPSLLLGMLINDVPARYKFKIFYVKFIQKLVNDGFGRKYGRLSACYIRTDTSYIFYLASVFSFFVGNSLYVWSLLLKTYNLMQII